MKYNLNFVPILVVFFIFLAISFSPIFFAAREASISILSDKLKIKDMYGRDISFSEIDDINLTSRVPEVTVRRKGISINGHKKGCFKTSKDSIVYFYLIKDYQVPLIRIDEKNDISTYISLGTVSNNKSVYQEIKNVIN